MAPGKTQRKVKRGVEGEIKPVVYLLNRQITQICCKVSLWKCRNEPVSIFMRRKNCREMKEMISLTPWFINKVRESFREGERLRCQTASAAISAGRGPVISK